MKRATVIGLMSISLTMCLFAMGRRAESVESSSAKAPASTAGKPENKLAVSQQPVEETQVLQEGTTAQTVLQTQREYVPEVIINGKWGTGPGEFGYLIHNWEEVVYEDRYRVEYATFSKVIGPTNLAVNEKGYIYILDIINKRIQKFNDKGEFLKAINIEVPKYVIYDNYDFLSMYVDDYENIYLYYTPNQLTWLIYNKDGELLKTIIGKKDIDETINRTKESIKRIITDKDKYYEQHPEEKNKLLAKYEKDLNMYEEIYSSPKTILLHEKPGNIEIDNNGNIYLNEYKINSGNIEKIPADQIGNIHKESMIDRISKLKNKIKQIQFTEKDGKSISFFNELVVTRYLTNDGVLYWLINKYSLSEIYGILVIKWKEKQN